MSSVEVFYPSGREVNAWAASHAAGLVPDRWPYGLHQVRSGSGAPVAYSEAKPLTASAIVNSLVRTTLGRTNVSCRDLVSMAWDEDTAIRLFTQRPNAKKYSGVIWATDRILRKDTNIKDAILRRILPRFDGLWVLGRAQIDVLQKWLGDDAPPVSFLRFGIDEKFFSPWSYPAKPLILSVGRDRDRDSKTLFEALEEVMRQRPDVDVAVQTFSSAPTPAGVKVLPMMPHAELRSYYKAASVVAVATRPNVHVSGMTVALESMASARPVVISETAGMTDYVENGTTGLLVRPGDANAMAHGLLDLLADPDAASEMGRQGRLKVERQHTTEQMAADLTRLLK